MQDGKLQQNKPLQCQTERDPIITLAAVYLHCPLPKFPSSFPFYHHSITILSNPSSMPTRLLYADLASGCCLLSDPTCRAAFIGFTTWLAYRVPLVAMEANSQAEHSRRSTETSKSHKLLSSTQGFKEMLTCNPTKILVRAPKCILILF